MIAAFIDGLFRYQFLQNALLTSIIVGLISGVLVHSLFYVGCL